MGFRERLGAWVESAAVRNFIVAVIIINAITLGLETSATVQRHFGEALAFGEQLILGIFVVEIVLKLIAFDRHFFRSGWNLFDFLIVGVSLLPGSGPLAILRSLRILRVLRLLSSIRRLRLIIESLLAAIPSIGWIVFLLLMVFYIFAVMGTHLFGAAFPEWFGTVPASMYTLFQVMTLESWSMGIARPVMEQFPHAYLYFVPFVLISSLTILNVFIGIIVNTMAELHAEAENAARAEAEAKAHAEREEMLTLLRQLAAQVDDLRQSQRSRAPEENA
ncbi:MAG TPA: ion transporter [Gammaproteobacteria bacterium]|nr:ion transporter [Gammaproteobacteria bacterium]